MAFSPSPTVTVVPPSPVSLSPASVTANSVASVSVAIKGSKSGDWSVAEDGTVTSGGLALVDGEYALETVAGSADAGSATGLLPRGGFVVLDTDVTPELAAEGLARDLVRAVQQARRDAGLDVSDRIALTIGGLDP